MKNHFFAWYNILFNYSKLIPRKNALSGFELRDEKSSLFQFVIKLLNLLITNGVTLVNRTIKIVLVMLLINKFELNLLTLISRRK